MVFFKIVIFLLLINITPVLLSIILGDVGNQPIDFGFSLKNGRQLLGAHKTIRGFIGAIVVGGILGFFMEFPVSISLLAASLSMLGDLLSSLIKRQLGLEPGVRIVILDQVFEASFPIAFFYKADYLSLPLAIACLLFFVPMAHAASILGEEMDFKQAGGRLRYVRSSRQFKHWRSCHEPLPVVARYLNFENSFLFRYSFEGFLKLTRLYEKGLENALDVQLKKVRITDSRIGSPFAPFTILFISDLHIDGLDGLLDRLIRLVDPLEVDVCLLGGDFRFKMYGGFYKTTSKLRKLVRHIHAREGIYGVLGNHDCLEFAPELEDTGICMLINDAEAIERNGHRLWIVGVDDPHYYKCHDLEKALVKTGKDDYKILLSHSPEIINDCKGDEVNLCLCGHTHGGQIRFPGIGAPYTHVKVPRRFTLGSWRYGSIKGYTTSGAGSSGVPVRFHCHPEIVLITVRKFILNP